MGPLITIFILSLPFHFWSQYVFFPQRVEESDEAHHTYRYLMILNKEKSRNIHIYIFLNVHVHMYIYIYVRFLGSNCVFLIMTTLWNFDCSLFKHLPLLQSVGDVAVPFLIVFPKSVQTIRRIVCEVSGIPNPSVQDLPLDKSRPSERRDVPWRHQKIHPKNRWKVAGWPWLDWKSIISKLKDVLKVIHSSSLANASLMFPVSDNCCTIGLWRLIWTQNREVHTVQPPKKRQRPKSR